MTSSVSLGEVQEWLVKSGYEPSGPFIGNRNARLNPEDLAFLVRGDLTKLWRLLMRTPRVIPGVEETREDVLDCTVLVRENEVLIKELSSRKAYHDKLVSHRGELEAACSAMESRKSQVMDATDEVESLRIVGIEDPPTEWSPMGLLATSTPSILEGVETLVHELRLGHLEAFMEKIRISNDILRSKDKDPVGDQVAKQFVHAMRGFCEQLQSVKHDYESDLAVCEELSSAIDAEFSDSFSVLSENERLLTGIHDRILHSTEAILGNLLPSLKSLQDVRPRNFRLREPSGDFEHKRILQRVKDLYKVKNSLMNNDRVLKELHVPEFGKCTTESSCIWSHQEELDHCKSMIDQIKSKISSVDEILSLWKNRSYERVLEDKTHNGLTLEQYQAKWKALVIEWHNVHQ